MVWEAEVRALRRPVLITAGDADVATLEHSVAMFRLLGGGIMGDMGQPLPAAELLAALEVGLAFVRQPVA